MKNNHIKHIDAGPLYNDNGSPIHIHPKESSSLVPTRSPNSLPNMSIDYSTIERRVYQVTTQSEVVEIIDRLKKMQIPGVDAFQLTLMPGDFIYWYGNNMGTSYIYSSYKHNFPTVGSFLYPFTRIYEKHISGPKYELKLSEIKQYILQEQSEYIPSKSILISIGPKRILATADTIVSDLRKLACQIEDDQFRANLGPEYDGFM